MAPPPSRAASRQPPRARPKAKPKPRAAKAVPVSAFEVVPLAQQRSRSRAPAAQPLLSPIQLKQLEAAALLVPPQLLEARKYLTRLAGSVRDLDGVPGRSAGPLPAALSTLAGPPPPVSRHVVDTEALAQVLRDLEAPPGSVEFSPPTAAGPPPAAPAAAAEAETARALSDLRDVVEAGPTEARLGEALREVYASDLDVLC